MRSGAALRGSAETKRLAAGFNSFADAHAVLARDVEERVREANARIEQERKRLAALMSELAQSVIVCNVEGRILLYNARAMQLLRKPIEGEAAAGKAVTLVGLTGGTQAVKNPVSNADVVLYKTLVLKYEIPGAAIGISSRICLLPSSAIVLIFSFCSSLTLRAVCTSARE